MPTGNESQGLGTGETSLGTLLLYDHAYRNWYFGVNTELFFRLSGAEETEFEFASVVSYSFIHGTGEGVAPLKPSQRFVPAISIELISESILSGAEEGENVVSILPGFHLWHPSSGWQVRLGSKFPISADRESDFSVLLQLSNHFSWR